MSANLKISYSEKVKKLTQQEMNLIVSKFNNNRSELARRLGVNPPTITQWLKRGRIPLAWGLEIIELPEIKGEHSLKDVCPYLDKNLKESHE